MILVNKKHLKDMKKTGEFLYLLQIGDCQNGKRHIKIGTTNDMARRMNEHHRKYKEDIYVIWCKAVKSKWTTLRKEEENKEFWKKKPDWIYQRNDRFWIPQEIEEVVIRINKKYHISFDCLCFEWNSRMTD